MIFKDIPFDATVEIVRKPGMFGFLRYLFNCFIYKVNVFWFKLLVSYNFGYPGTIVECNDYNVYRVIHNNYENTVILYSHVDNTFMIVQCALLNNYVNTCQFVYTAPVEFRDDDVLNYSKVSYYPLFAVQWCKNSTNVCDFHKILKEFSRIMESCEDRKPFRYILDQHSALLKLCENAI